MEAPFRPGQDPRCPEGAVWQKTLTQDDLVFREQSSRIRGGARGSAPYCSRGLRVVRPLQFDETIKLK
jgi:hypothetical protein